MAGVKGRSGGPRANSGGYREGSGRKPNPPVFIDDPTLETSDPIQWLKALMNLEAAPMAFRIQAATELRTDREGVFPPNSRFRVLAFKRPFRS